MNWLPNQLRILLSGLAYTLIEAIRRLYRIIYGQLRNNTAQAF